MERRYYSELLLNYKPYTTERKIHPPIKILRIICQRPYFTGSGINLINLTKKTSEKEIDQFIVFGQPAGQEFPLKDIIDNDHVKWVTFQGTNDSIQCDVNFPVPGMSDQMPYRSTKFSDFSLEMLESYLMSFAEKLRDAVDQFKPNLIHSHHLWLVSALCRVLFPEIPMITSCHNTGLRQMVLAKHLKKFIVNPIKDIDAIAVQNEEQEKKIVKLFNFKKNQKLHIIGQGINTDIFYPLEQNLEKSCYSIVYVGKLSNSKGVPQLIQAFKEILEETSENLELKIVGSGKGSERDEIVKLAAGFKERIHFLGQINQEELAEHLRMSDIFILPSFYDSIPKVLLESLATGCRAIITDLPGIQESITRGCGENDIVQYIKRPRMKSIDKPLEEDIPDFIKNIKEKIRFQLSCIKDCKDVTIYSEKVRDAFSWQALFEKYLKLYNSFIERNPIE